MILDLTEATAANAVRELLADLAVVRAAADRSKRQVTAIQKMIDGYVELFPGIDALPACEAKRDHAKVITEPTTTSSVTTRSKILIATPEADPEPVPVNEGGAIAAVVPVADSRTAFFCETCNARFDDAELCVAHEATCGKPVGRGSFDQPKPRTVSCPECDQTFGSAAGLGSHRKYKHGVPSTQVTARGTVPPPTPAAKAPVQQLAAGLTLRCGEAGCTFTCKWPIDIENHARSTHGRRALPAERTPAAV